MNTFKILIGFVAISFLVGCNEPLNTVGGFPSPTEFSSQTEPNQLTELTRYEPADMVEFEEYLNKSKTEKKPILIDFNGVNCVNCRNFEQNIWLS